MGAARGTDKLQMYDAPGDSRLLRGSDMNSIDTKARLDEAQRRFDEAKAEESRASEAAAYAASHRQRLAKQLEMAQHSHNIAIAPPVDRSAVQLTDGSPVPKDRSHVEHTESGQQKGYIVLTDAERAKGFVRQVRDAYRHTKCHGVTTMGRALAETYARDPDFYSGTFCTTCRSHFPVGPDGEFVWLENDGAESEKVGT